MKKNLISLVALFCLVSCTNLSDQNSEQEFNYTEFKQPKHYMCNKVDNMVVDGKLDDWKGIAWTEYFNDIEGVSKPTPRHKTRAKMAWDDQYLYIVAELEEPHVWANIEERDEVIFFDNDFEVFIDPDGDGHHYYELEVNAFETAWDLLLTKPYRDFGHVIDSWDIIGLKVGVSVDGTINDPSDEDKGWIVELALPFSVLQECSNKDTAPTDGDYWRINFSRVEWKTEVKDGEYVKQINPDTGKAFPEDNWVWSPQYHVNMHMPEYWGFIVFVDTKDAENLSWSVPADEHTKWHLRNVYYQQKQYFEEFSQYAESAADLGWTSDQSNIELPLPEVLLTKSGYQAVLPSSEKGTFWIIDETGRIYKI